MVVWWLMSSGSCVGVVVGLRLWWLLVMMICVF